MTLEAMATLGDDATVSLPALPGWIALGLGVASAIGLSVVLVWIMHISAKRGYDEAAI